MAVSSIHEGLNELVRDRPTFVTDLLAGVLGMSIPAFAEVRTADATLNQPMPVESYADAAVLLVENKPVLGVIWEAQFRKERRKRYTWPLYAVAARARHECQFTVLVVTLDAKVARWARQPIDLGNGMIFRARVIGPEDIPKLIDLEQGKRDPQLAVLSTMAHGRGELDTAVQVGRVAYEAAASLSDDNQRLLYSSLITHSLSEAAREVLKMTPRIWSIIEGLDHGPFKRGKAEGRVEGEAKALLKVLAQRGLVVSDAQRQQIASCTDLTMLERWLDGALTAASVDELLR